jgi:hypothetical protein
MLRGLFGILLATAVGLSTDAEAAPACASPGPGTHTTTKYAGNCPAVNGWNYENLAQGAPDGQLAETPNLDAGEDLVCTNFGVCDPTGTDTIKKVVVGVRSKQQYASGPYQVIVKLTAGGTLKKTFSHTGLEWDDLDITSLKGAWSWDDVVGLDARISLHDHPQGNNDSDVFVDSVRVVVTYDVCSPNASKTCIGGNSFWVDSCGAVGAMAQACNDGQGCTNDACNNGECSFTPTPAVGTTCHQGNIHSVDSCGGIGGMVQACNDNNACTNNGCAGNTCVFTPTPKVSKTCVNNVLFWVDSCGAATEVAENCDDQNACTDDACTPGGCVHTTKPLYECCAPAGFACIDNNVYQKNACNITGALVAACNDNDPCTIDSCDAGSGTCKHVVDLAKCPVCEPSQLKCVDNNLADVDLFGKVKSIVAICDDGDSCTTDVCNAAAATCEHVESSSPACTCKKGTQFACQGNSVVLADLCGNFINVLESCDDGVACTLDVCDATQGTCKHEPIQGPPCVCTPTGKICQDNKLFVVDDCGNLKDGVECSDSDPCTINYCDAAANACASTPSSAPDCVCKPKGNVCSGNSVVAVDTCGSITAIVENCDDGDACTIDSCDPDTVGCRSDAIPGCDCSAQAPSASCDANALVTKDGCGNVVSVATCDDGDECTVDACDAAEKKCTSTKITSGACCSPEPVSQTCQGNSLLWVDECGNVVGVAEECDDGNPCTVDYCDGTIDACATTPLLEGDCCKPNEEQACVNGQVRWLDSCGNAGAVVDSCDDGKPCTDNGCAGADCTFTPSTKPECQPCQPFATTRCEDGNVVWVDSCDNQGALAVLCDDGDPCTTDGCDDKSNLCVHLPTGGGECPEDPRPCSGEPTKSCNNGHLIQLDACGAMVGIAESCLDGDPCTVDSCNSATSACEHTPIEGVDGCGTDCADAAPTKVCDANSVILIDGCGKPAGVVESCDDGDDCTSDSCAAGVCANVEIPGCGGGEAPEGGDEGSEAGEESSEDGPGEGTESIDEGGAGEGTSGESDTSSDEGAGENAGEDAAGEDAGGDALDSTGGEWEPTSGGCRGTPTIAALPVLALVLAGIWVVSRRGRERSIRLNQERPKAPQSGSKGENQ